MKHLRKFHETVEANRTAGGRPRYVYCSAAFYSALFDDIIAHARSVPSEQNLLGIPLVCGCEVRIDSILDDDTIVVLGGPIDTVS
jgi:hypothetical protein